jgi:hypothetical protein
MLSTIP